MHCLIYFGEWEILVSVSPREGVGKCQKKRKEKKKRAGSALSDRSLLTKYLKKKKKPNAKIAN